MEIATISMRFRNFGALHFISDSLRNNTKRAGKNYKFHTLGLILHKSFFNTRYSNVLWWISDDIDIKNSIYHIRRKRYDEHPNVYIEKKHLLLQSFFVIRDAFAYFFTKD